MKSTTSIARLLLFAGMMLYAATSVAQWYDPEKVKKDVADIYGKAYEAAEAGQYRLAVDLVNKAIEKDKRFVDGYLTRAGIFANEKNYAASVADFQQALLLDSIYSATYRLPYSISLAGAGRFEEALQAILQFLQNPAINSQSKRAANYRKSVYEFAVTYQRQHPSGTYLFEPQNMGDSINSVYAEYYPSITIDGKKLVFTRKVKEDEDFYEASKTEQGWTGSIPLIGKVNTNFNEGAQHISQDGNWIVFTGCNYPEGMGSCDLYISYRNDHGWSESVNLGPTVNSEYWESAPALSPDKQLLFFSSNRPGGFGGKDIWMSQRNSRGKWEEPVNLGPAINTSADESCPFMHADNQTLFFNSNGHPGYGGTDLYFSIQTDSGWAIPTNLGYPINTIDEEGSLIVSADGQTAWYASERSDTRGALDLYSFPLRPDLRPKPTRWVRGQVYDVITKAGIPSTVELTELSTRKKTAKVQTDENGYYLTTLPEGSEYAFNVNRKGYLFYSRHIDLRTSISDTAHQADIPLQPIVAGASVVLENIFFESGKTNLSDKSKAELDQVIQLMNDHPKLRIEIDGHTDAVGRATENQLLSEGRAKAVLQYLLSSRQIAAQRIVAKGFGATRPVTENQTEAGRAKNRRTEMRVISNE